MTDEYNLRVCYANYSQDLICEQNHRHSWEPHPPVTHAHILTHQPQKALTWCTRPAAASHKATSLWPAATYTSGPPTLLPPANLKGEHVRMSVCVSMCCCVCVYVLCVCVCVCGNVCVRAFVWRGRSLHRRYAQAED
jgi:hypothetical protein